uniref:Ras-GEF domain-containing protein n=1 Tax=Schistocephalus solidus TaxID=70667 RepID=A0A0X3Q1D1_SCHSO
MSSEEVVVEGHTAIIQRPPTKGDIFSPEKDIFLLPSVEQMQMDVANATFELQKAYIPRSKQHAASLEGIRQEKSFHTLNGLGVEDPDSSAGEEVPDSEDNLPNLPDSDDDEDPSQRTREETVSEELLINGKRYRHTYQRRVVLERQKTREVFVLPTSTASLKPSTSQLMSKEGASNLTSCNRSLDRHASAKSGSIGGDRGSYGMRLDLSVQNQGGAFSPVVVLLPENEPGTPLLTADHIKGDTLTRSEQGQAKLDNQEMDEGLSNEPAGVSKHETPNSVHDASLKTDRPTAVEIEPAVTAENNCDTPTTPLLLSHMYHFGQWDMTAPILDPRLPVGITQHGSDAAELAFSVSPAEWHQTDISYGDTSGGNGGATSTFGTVAKGRIVACLQRFTQKSARTGRHLYRSTYVQHTKIARWRSTNKEMEHKSPQEFNSPEHRPQFSSSAPEGSAGGGLFDKHPNELSTLEGIWKQGARAGESLATTAPHLTPLCTLLDACSYDRLQLLQSICPAAAAATVILGRQMPDMRRLPGQMARGGQPASVVGESAPASPIFTVSADAWCPRELMMLEVPPDALIFMSPAGCTRGGKRGGNEVTGVEATTAGPPNPDQNGGQSAHHDCLLRGGTLDGLIVYSLKILRENQTRSYESLVPDIFLKLYSTFTTVNEVACRLMQRYIAFAPIEPGGLGCLMGDEQNAGEGAWTEALNTARFLVKVLSEAASNEFSSQFMLKIVHYARVLQMDSKNAQKRLSSDGQIHADWINGHKEDDSLDVDRSETGNQAVSCEEDTEYMCFQDLPKQLENLANQLLLLIPYSAGGLKVTSKADGHNFKVRVPVKRTTIASKTTDPINYCSCQERLHKLLRFDTREIAEQITLNEEKHFQKIDGRKFRSHLANLVQLWT